MHPPARSALRHNAALEGLRGVALLGVLLFHAPFSWMSGGFLGVSTFFTLSGFLITSVLLDTHARAGRIAFGTFWTRRLRRLVPSLAIGVLAVLATSPWWVPPAAMRLLPGDALASFFYYANWWFMRPEYAYSRLFADPSPLQHCWSLAIEAQFYLVYPLALWWALRASRPHRSAALVLATGIAASIVLAWAPSNVDDVTYRIYYGTGARAAELLVGALLAVAHANGRARGSTGGRNLVGTAAALGIGALWTTSHVESPWLYHGGFFAYGVLSTAVLWSALDGRTFVHRAFATRPLRALGRVSYAGYVYHWPLFLVLDEDATGLAPGPLFALRFLLTVGLATLTTRTIEDPIRRSERLRGRSAAWAVLATSVAVVTLAGALDVRGSADDVASRRPEESAESLRIGIFGDSVAGSLIPGLRAFLSAEAGAVLVPTPGRACRLGDDDGEYEQHGRWRRRPRGRCDGFPSAWGRLARERDLDLAIVLVGPHEVRNRRLRAGGPALSLGDAALDSVVARGVASGMDSLRRAGVPVVWLTSPRVRLRLQPDPDHRSEAEASDPARMERLNELIIAAAAERETDVAVVDLAAFVDAWPGGPLSPSLRPDGVHFDEGAARELVDSSLGPALLDALARLASGSRRRPDPVH